MSKILLIVAHPDLADASKANAALVNAVSDLDHVTVHDLYAAYPDFAIDVEAEQNLLLDHDVIVFQHPVYWYNVPPLFKLWQDKVFTMPFAFTPDRSPSQLSGKKGIVAATTGVPAEHYTLEGANRTTLEALLENWTATLRLCQFDVQPLFKVHGVAFGGTDEDLATSAKDYRELMLSYAD
ncbi:NADP(H) oxidoreductase [Rhodococcus sp. Leaf7]|uniref:NAD(P)H-dependent oxidoreductase n=1 Tax=unclassified Rhodococcus (in: high G+C Gram-positive bacteria) TaxID=192944 RepID=UPI0006F42A71|nr:MULTISPECIES: NAD(P)H-dependent oxidoreductase [unclassified Rhodococcus (in: high G+C Gram-positive bacteria)]KQU02379.1 NADP(H) oxidoreductase [Rhodococcus sp. Leaf7]KQU37851.1 NADP(H) oxidoreductase [Rhodococcus sp. Leaf247]